MTGKPSLPVKNELFIKSLKIMMIKFYTLFLFTGAGSIEEIYPGQTGIEKMQQLNKF